MGFTTYIRGLVKRNPDLNKKLKKGDSKLTAFQYMYQTVSMTVGSILGLFVLIFLMFKTNMVFMLSGFLVALALSPFIYKFWFSVIDVQIARLGRELDSDVLFVSEYLLVSLESGLPLGNAIENISKIDRPGGHFFKRVYLEFKTGKSFEDALDEGATFSASKSLKTLIKKLKDSMNIGVDLRVVLTSFILDSSEKKLLEVKSFSKRLNPIIMMYLLIGIVVPSLGVTFFILGAAIVEITPAMLRVILMFIFLIMFGFQYFAYSSFKFSKSTI